MEAAASLRYAPNFFAASNFVSKSRVLASLGHAQPLKDRRSISLTSNQGWRQRRPIPMRRSLRIRASSESGDGPLAPIAPLQLESPVGQLLSQILVSHPHLLPATVDQQLHQLQSDRDAEKLKNDPSPSSSSGTDLVLYRRIAEVKASERRRALEEILYMMIVQKFMDAGVPLVPALSQGRPSPQSGKVDHWSSEENKLQQLHSPEAYEMIKNHLTLILGQRLEDSNAIAPISKLRVGQVYAASIMYGYFLKRVDQRFQLEKSMKTLPLNSPAEAEALANAPPAFPFPAEGIEDRVKPCKLRSYVMALDAETLQRYATIRSKEAFGIIEKHTEALFGRPEIVITPEGAIDSSKDELIKISFAGLKRLILEAVTFGSFLWDVESYVDSRYHFAAN
ncbi:UV-B-induced protein At3g17800, chloroplastic [Dioscorea cayenensis subsp. rotundata]|uniref:UV-B-induced protein At3g17800, chloroplastic n=1 Tax=Dioscorea cayennensis subsp. rotundata TaxID=55577 RepID=A0AB40BK73_DIOCR|nr:UV-B-induced protein At3g17800, chloroplastic [Dioscorea cayenensis subsp. rotundata]